MEETNYVSSGGKIKVVGVGDAGCDAMKWIRREQLRAVEFIAMNTDANALALTEAATRIQLRETDTGGLGCADRAVGRKAAEDLRGEVELVVAGSDITFIIAGMGDCTATGSAPMVAEVSKQSGALTIAIVTAPLGFESNYRNGTAEQGARELLDKVDTLVIIPNDQLSLTDQVHGVNGAFGIVEEVLTRTVLAFAELVTAVCLINPGFADVCTIMKDSGHARISIGHGSGPNRAADAAKDALASPMLDMPIGCAMGVLFNIAGGPSLSLCEVNSAAKVVGRAVRPDAKVMFCVVLDPRMGSGVRMTLIATGFGTKEVVGVSEISEAITLLEAGESQPEQQVRLHAQLLPSDVWFWLASFRHR